jgi:hypothetical protein
LDDRDRLGETGGAFPIGRVLPGMTAKAKTGELELLTQSSGPYRVLTMHAVVVGRTASRDDAEAMAGGPAAIQVIVP